MNNVNLIGRLTGDVELKHSGFPKNQIYVARITLAVDNPYSKNEERKTDFIRIVAFNGTAQFAERYLHKGVRVGVTGRIQTGSYEHEDGYTVYTTDVVASNFYFADSAKETQRSTPNEAPKKGNTKYKQ